MDLMNYLAIAGLMLVAYLFGSIPTAVWIGKAVHGIDVREHGSGNAGATNVMRVLGVRTGVPVLLLDMFKGYAAVSLVFLQRGIQRETEGWMILSVVLGVFAVVGHIFPLFAGFRGGKGVATIAGIGFAVHPAATGIALLVFAITVWVSRYVSLGSILAGLTFPITLFLIIPTPYLSLQTFSILIAATLLITHRKNIKRLAGGEENRANFLFRNKN